MRPLPRSSFPTCPTEMFPRLHLRRVRGELDPQDHPPGSLVSLANRLPGGMHYAWVIVAILSLVQVIGYSISMAAGVVVIPLSDPEGDFGWSMAIIGLALMMYYFVGGLLAPVTGWLGDRYGSRRILLVGGVFFGASMVLTGVVSEPWQFVLTFGLLLAIPESLCFVPLTAG